MADKNSGTEFFESMMPTVADAVPDVEVKPVVESPAVIVEPDKPSASPDAAGLLQALMQERDDKNDLKRRVKAFEDEQRAAKQAKDAENAEPDDPMPDPIIDPKGWKAWDERRITGLKADYEEQIKIVSENIRAEGSEREWKAKLDPAKWDALNDWIRAEEAKRPGLIDHMRGQDDPYAYAHRRFVREQNMTSLGRVATGEQTIEEYHAELRAKWLEETGKAAPVGVTTEQLEKALDANAAPAVSTPPKDPKTGQFISAEAAKPAADKPSAEIVALPAKRSVQSLNEVNGSAPSIESEAEDPFNKIYKR